MATQLIDAVVGLGGNVGDPVAAFVAAVHRLAGQGRLLGLSPLYRSRPVGPASKMAGQPDFYNAALRLEFAGAPLDLLGLLMEIEREQGRERREHWGPRTLDLDLLWIAGQGVESSLLQVPHPRLLERAFALVPLLSLVPTARDPRTGQDYLSALLSLGTAGLEVIDDTRWDAACVQLASH